MDKTIIYSILAVATVVLVIVMICVVASASDDWRKGQEENYSDD